MKAIKLFLVFTVILGAIILAFFIIPDSGGKALSPIPDNTHEMYRKQFISFESLRYCPTVKHSIQHEIA